MEASMKYNDDMVYNEKTNKWYKNGKGAGHSLEKACANCNEQYFMRIDKPTEYCCRSCANSGKNNPMYGKTHTDEVVKGLKETGKRATKAIREKYGVNNVSQLPSVKDKKGQLVVTYDIIKPLVEKSRYNLISIDGNTKRAVLTLVCPEGHEFEMRWESWKRGHRCVQCFYDSLIAKGISDIEGFRKYSHEVRVITRRIYRKHKDIINPLNLKRSRKKGDGYQLDHKYSIAEGFKNNVPVEVIASIPNLEMLTVSENATKQDKCSITLNELMEKYNEKHI